MLTVIMNFHFFRGKDNNNNTNITLLSSTVRCFSLYHIDIIKPRSVRFAKQHQNPPSRSHLFTSRIWVHAMIGLLKKLLLICQSGLKEIRNTLYSHTHPLSPWYKFIESLGSQNKDQDLIMSVTQATVNYLLDIFHIWVDCLSHRH